MSKNFSFWCLSTLVLSGGQEDHHYHLQCLYQPLTNICVSGRNLENQTKYYVQKPELLAHAHGRPQARTNKQIIKCLKN